MKGDSEREVAIFIEALTVPFQERAAFLERVCGSEERLRQKMEALLRAHDRLRNVLEDEP
jgi:hypothetical protein